jgi:hypothetical protein
MNHLPGGGGVFVRRPYLRYQHTLAMRNLEFLFDLSVVRWRGCKCLAHYFMMRRRMMFCEIICQILISRAPVHVKLALFHSVFYPIKAHVHGFCAFLFYGTVAVPCGSGIIRFHWCGGGCLCPNSSNVVLSTAPSLAFIKTAPIYVWPPTTLRV